MVLSIDGWLDDVHKSQFSAQEFESAKTGTSPPTLKRKHEQIEGTDTETPRRLRNLPLQLESAPLAFNAALTPSDSARRESRLGQSHDGTRLPTASNATESQSSSPIMRKRDLHFTRPEIHFEGMHSFVKSQTRLEEQTALLQGLVAVIRDSQKALPRDLQPYITPPTRDIFFTRPPNYSDDATLDNFQKLESKIARIIKTTKEMIEEKCHEDEWSDTVVRFILDLSRNRARHSEDIRVANVKTISVEPKELLPTYQCGVPVQKKPVDYVFAANMLDIETVQNFVAEVPYQTLNQTDCGRLYDRALFSHLGIKRLRDRQEADVQLGIWCSAGFKKLEEMRSQKHEHGSGLAAHPIWFVQADLWSLSIAIQESAEQVTIFGPLLEWSTLKSDQVAFLIMTISNIMDWGWKQYRPWFMDHIGMT